MAKKKKVQKPINWIVMSVVIVASLFTLFFVHRQISRNVDQRCSEKLGESWYGQFTIYGLNTCVNKDGEVKNI